MKKKWLLILLCGLLPFNAQAAGISQQRWMEQLVYSLGWSFGLPDKPVAEDYLHLLAGQRRVRVEAEDARQRSDRVSLKSFISFGPFSGAGWLSGISEPTQAHLRFILPHSGRYRISARAYLAGHQLQLAGQSFMFDGQDQFSLVELGEVELEAGKTEILVTLPSGGGLDYVELSAPPLGPISPESGWQPDEPLNATVAARTLVQALGLQGVLPPAGRRYHLEAESMPHPGLALTRIRYRGEPSGGEWLQAGGLPAVFDFSLPALTPGCYSLRLRAQGRSFFEVGLEGLFARKANFAPYLDERDLGSFFLPHEGLRLSVTVPAGGGVDSLELLERRSSAADLKRLVGLPIVGEELSREQADAFLALVAVLGGFRQDLR